MGVLCSGEDVPSQQACETPVAPPTFELYGDEENPKPRLITKKQAEEFLPYLEGAYRHEWRMIYNNYSSYGSSIRQFQTQVCYRGPTVLLVKDKGGSTFGCYASVGWEVTNKFYGDAKCFLFKFSPSGEFQRIEYSGRDNNFMYFNLGKETMPCGLAMGGRFDVGGPNGWFALFLDDELKTGESHANTLTFEKQPCVVSAEKFEVHDIEVFRVSIPSAEEEALVAEMNAGKKSVLLSKDAQAVVSMMGRENHREKAGVKQSDLEGGTGDDDVGGGLTL